MGGGASVRTACSLVNPITPNFVIVHVAAPPTPSTVNSTHLADRTGRGNAVNAPGGSSRLQSSASVGVPTEEGQGFEACGAAGLLHTLSMSVERRAH